MAQKTADKLVQHKHCTICGKAIPLEKEVCSEKCLAELQKLIKKRRITLYVFYILAFVIVIALVVLQVIQL